MPLTIWSILEDSLTLILPTPSLLRSGKLNFPLIHSRCVSLFLPHRPHYHLLTAPTSPTRLPLPRPFTLLLFPPLHLCYHLFIPSYSKHNLRLYPPGPATSQFPTSPPRPDRTCVLPPLLSLIPEPPVTPPPSSWLIIRRFIFYCNTICLSINCSFYWLRDNIDTLASKWSSYHWACNKRIEIQIFLESPAVFVHNATSADFLYHCDSSERK